MHPGAFTRGAAGGEHTICTAADGQVFSWGACGLGWNRLQAMTGLHRLKSVAALQARIVRPGYYHNLAIGAGKDAALYSWGCGVFPGGEGDGIAPALGRGLSEKDVGTGPKKVIGLPCEPVIDAAAGAYHSVALTASGQVFTFGAAQLGQLGRPVANSSITDGSSLPIDPVPGAVVGLPSPSTDPVESIGAGFYNTLVTCRSGAVYCAGENQNQQCGVQNGRTNLHSMSSVPELSKMEDRVVQICGGYCHTLALTESGKVFSLGCGDDGQRGDGLTDGNAVVTRVQLMPGEQDDSTKVVSIAAGANHSVVLDRAGRVFTFGSNEHGQCGQSTSDSPRAGAGDEEIDDEDNILFPTQVQVAADRGRVVAISAGYAHTVLTTESGRVLVFGQNTNGQLGMDPEQVESSAMPRDL